MKLQTLIEATHAIEKQWQVCPAEPAIDYNSLLENLKRRLSTQILDCLRNDMEHLINTLYRLDIREPDFHSAMQAPSLEEIASLLAEIVIRREMEKAAWREKYRNRQ